MQLRTAVLNQREPRMNTDEHGLRFEKETRQIIRCAMEAD